MRVLVAGIGNIFFGDDAFGVEVVRELSQERFPEGVTVRDFGIRSYDLAYAILDGYDAVILVDATPRGLEPGTVSLIELDADHPALSQSETSDAHSLNPVQVLQMVSTLGGKLGRMYLVGCEPAVLETDEVGLSPSVQASVPQAAALVRDFVAAMLKGEEAQFIKGDAGELHAT
jgi:hydrogenase maturation protease